MDAMEVEDCMDNIPLRLRAPKIPSTRSSKLSMDSEFLKLVKQNDVSGVKRLVEGDCHVDLEECDEQGRSALIIAVDHNNCDIIQYLMGLDVDPSDAFFHAIETHSTSAVQTICTHLPQTRKLEVLNGFPVSQNWPSLSKPLILAARLDNFEIVKTLIQHGAEIPSFEDLRPQVANDSYGQFLALLHWYEAVSNESYIMLTSDDPLETIFKLGHSLDKLEDFMTVPRFKQDCNHILARLAALSAKLLSLARDDKEVALLLNGGMQETTDMPALPHRIRQALNTGFKEFVSHPSSQDYMASQWGVPSPHNTKSRIRSALLCLSLIVFFFVPCVLYILLPVKKLHIMKRPYVRFVLHLASRLYFILLLILSTLGLHQTVSIDFGQFRQENLTRDEVARRYVQYQARPWDTFTILIVIWIVGMTYRNIREIVIGELRHFTRDNLWAVFNNLQLFFYWVFIIASVVAYIQAVHETRLPDFYTDAATTPAATTPAAQAEMRGPSALPTQLDQSTTLNLSQTVPAGHDEDPTNPGIQNRYDWNPFHPVLIAEASFGVANVLTYLHLFHSLLILGLLGPLLISFRGMLTDVAKFFFIFISVWISFAIGLTQVYRAFETLDYETCVASMDKTECAPTPFLSFWHSMFSLGWSLFDLMDLSNLRLSVHNDLYFTGAVGSLLYAVFMWVAVLVLLNMLIAMMSSTFARVEENSEVEWKVARTRLMGEYMAPSVTLPPPFNLVPTCKSLLKVARLFRRKCSTSRSQPVPGHQETTDAKEAYMALSRTLVERYHRASENERIKRTQQSEGKQAMAELRNCVDKISQEMQELRLQIQKLASDK